MPEKSDLLFYEGLHGAVVTDKVNIAQHADLKIGVVPVINLEWIQKLHRDRSDRGYTAEAVTDTILRRMPDYMNYICPQFAETDINFQRVPTVDTSNPFIARWIPTPDKSMVVIRLKNPRGIDFPYLLSMIPNSFMSRANSIVIHGIEARSRDAAHPHPADPATDGTQEAHAMNDSRSVPYRQPAGRLACEMANAIRFLAIDAVENAKSGHPGMPMGMADVATVLFSRFLKFDPADPAWPDRDRFVLSAGHGSMLLYALLHLTGYEGVTADELKAFRQWGSKTPGHPEYGHTPGVETTTGPLGQGIATAVGMALAERLMNARFGDDLSITTPM